MSRPASTVLRRSNVPGETSLLAPTARTHALTPTPTWTSTYHARGHGTRLMWPECGAPLQLRLVECMLHQQPPPHGAEFVSWIVPFRHTLAGLFMCTFVVCRSLSASAVRRPRLKARARRSAICRRALNGVCLLMAGGWPNSSISAPSATPFQLRRRLNCLSQKHLVGRSSGRRDAKQGVAAAARREQARDHVAPG